MLAFIKGEPLDRVPFVQYDTIAPPAEVWPVVGRENIGLLTWTTAHRFEHPHCRFETTEIMVGRNQGLQTVLHTPAGTLTEIKHFEPTYHSPAIKEHFIKDLKDYQVFLSYLRDITVVPDFDPLYKSLQDLGVDGLPHCWIGRTPFQQMWAQWVSLEDLALHMIDEPDLLGECFDLLGRILVDSTKAIHDAPIPYFVIGDNITAPMIGERYFRKYCLPYYKQTAEIMADRNIPLVVHMDGDLKPLWQAIGESRVVGLDSFSPPPDNDTSAAEAVAMWPEKKLMLNFPSSVHLKPPTEIYRMARDILEQAGHTGRLQIQISENVPPGVWRTSYPEIIRAIEDFGCPL